MGFLLTWLITFEDWGFSYGTVIGQYMINILPPQRLGRIVIDGVVDAATWNLHADHFFDCEFVPFAYVYSSQPMLIFR